MNKDTVAGAVRKTGGEIREKVDGALGDKKGAELGREDKWKGAAQQKFGEAKDAIKKVTGN